MLLNNSTRLRCTLVLIVQGICIFIAEDSLSIDSLDLQQEMKISLILVMSIKDLAGHLVHDRCQLELSIIQRTMDRFGKMSKTIFDYALFS